MSGDSIATITACAIRASLAFAGGQLKASVTRNLDNGYVRVSVKHLNDRNQFVLDLPFTNALDPQYVPGLTDYVSMNTAEGLDQRVPHPDGRSDAAPR